jgi:hypothetical protein
MSPSPGGLLLHWRKLHRLDSLRNRLIEPDSVHGRTTDGYEYMSQTLFYFGITCLCSTAPICSLYVRDLGACHVDTRD